MQVSMKANLLGYFDQLIAQADFDSAGQGSNAHAMLAGLRADIAATSPDDVFTLRDSFVDGSEAKAREDALKPAPEPPVVVQADGAGGTDAVAGDTVVRDGDTAGAGTTTATPAISSGVEPTDPVEPGLQSDAHEQKQDAEIAGLKAALAKANPNA